LIITSFAEYQDKLLALGVTPGAPGSENQALASLKADLDTEKAAQVIAQVEADVLSQRDLKVFADKFATQIPLLKTRLNT
jgi:hypothetical protein